MKKLCSYNILC